MKNNSLQLLVFALLFTNALAAQEGFYMGGNLNSYFVREQVKSSDGSFDFSHSTFSGDNGFLTQSLGKYGFGLHLGFRKHINIKKTVHLMTVDLQYYYNHQGTTMESSFENLKVKTKANYNHGFRFAFGHHFKKVHPYIIVQAAYQNVTPYVSTINHNNIVYDVEDDGSILEETISTSGSAFTTEVFSFLGGFGIEIPLSSKWVLNMEYVPFKHVEYGLRDIDDSSKYFVNSLVVNQLQVGVRYFFFNPFKKKTK